MPTTNPPGETSPAAFIFAPVDATTYWPVTTRWRAVVRLRDVFRSPEWMLHQVKAVPLSSRVERSLFEAVRADDGRTVLERASEPGEHRVAAAVIAALRLAQDHPDRALRFLGWSAQSPDDPADLRFLRRYLPGLHVDVKLDPELGAAVPLGRDALGLLAAELFTVTGHADQAEAVLAGLSPSATVAVARAARRFAEGDFDGVHALAGDRPVFDDVTAALRTLDARASCAAGDAAAALAATESLLDTTDLAPPVQRMVRAVRADALRATGHEIEANLLDENFGMASSDEGSKPAEQDSPDRPRPPLFGRSLADALDDAWARVRRQPLPGPVTPLEDPATIEVRCEEAIALVHAGHTEAAETTMLAAMDHADAWVDHGGRVVDDFYVLLAGLFDQEGLAVEEVATLERLRDAHRRAGSDLDPEITERLVEVRATLDRLE